VTTEKTAAHLWQLVLPVSRVGYGQIGSRKVEGDLGCFLQKEAGENKAETQQNRHRKKVGD